MSDADPPAASTLELLQARAPELFGLAVLVTATVSLVSPLWTVSWLPFVDYPQHLGAIAALHGAHTPEFEPYFVVDLWRSQYLLYYGLGDLLSSFGGAENGARLATIVSIASLPLAVGALLRAHGRPAMLGALAAPVALHVYAFWGFINFSLGMSVSLVALAAHARLVARPDSRRAVFFALWAVLTFYAHAQLYAFLAVACLVQSVAMAASAGRARTLGALWRAALACLPSLGAVGLWLSRSNVLAQGESPTRNGLAAVVEQVAAPPIWSPIEQTLRHVLDHSFEYYADGAGELLAASFAMGAVLVIAQRGKDRALVSPSPSTGSPTPAWLAPAQRVWRRVFGEPIVAVRSLAPEAVLFTAVLGYLFAPVSYRLIEPISHRFFPLVLALVPVLGPFALPRWPSRLGLGALLTAIALFTGVVHAHHFTQTDEEMGDLDDALAAAPPGKRLLGLVYDRNSSIVPLPIYMHAHQYYQGRQGGLAAWSFVELPKSPVLYRAGHEPPPFPPRFEWAPELYDDGLYGPYFDLYLIRMPPGSGPPRVGAPRHAGHAYVGRRWHLMIAEPE